jgi:hypothetical protein
MRKFVISLAATGAALAVAAPAPAQYYPQPQPYGYGQPYGYNGYGYANYGAVRSLQVRVDRIQRELRRLAQVRAISPNEYRNRNEDARDIERRLRRDARDGRGLSGQEVSQLQYRIARLEQRIFRDTRDGRRGGYGYNNGYGYNGYDNHYGYRDRDRDGRNDRYEDDQGRDHDD